MTDPNLTPSDLRAILHATRGPPKDKCPRCLAPLKERDAHPVEGGDWVCAKCFEKEMLG